ncbi:MAG TPA: hypothetical protein PKC28_01740 [Bdellovibrionales bacterium]|nr:hypothetical protein [Bdellovibrionales bacterium]
MADIEWSGVYRFEGNFLKNSELSDRGRELSYGLNHLVLRPKIVAGDGITIYGQFNIFNDVTNYPNSQMGQVWGSGVRNAATPAAGTTSAQDSNTMSQTQNAETILVSQLYMTLSHEYGQLLLGRAPLHFGLGMTYNAGRGLFDHWYDTSDLVGYKFILGNIYILPMFGKSSEAFVHKNDDLNDYMVQLQYENPETDIQMGAFYQVRKGGESASDAPLGSIGSGAGTHTTSVNSKTVNVFALRDSQNIRLGLEAAFQSGETGVVNPNGEKVTWGGFGIVGEVEYRPEGSNWNWMLKAGTASGGDPATADKYEGYIFDRNYDVAFLLFNHPLGQADFLRTGAITGGTTDTEGRINKTDVEAISNVLYVAPGAKYKFNDRWSMDNTLVTGWLGTNPIVGSDTAKDLGYEWDISVNFTPRKGVMWVNQVGLLLPGDTWKAGNAFDSSFMYGFATKAAISF